MAVKNLFFKDAVAPSSTHGQLTETDPNVNSVTGTGWTGDTATGYSLQIYGTKRASSTFGATALPNASPVLTDCWRSLNTYSGTFAAGTWALGVTLSSAVNNGQTAAARFRVWRSANADGSGATEITSGAVEGTAVAVDSGNNLSTVTTGSLAAATLTNEYLFLQIALHITIAGAAASDTNVSVWSGGVGATAITTPNFTPTSSFVSDEDFFNPTLGANPTVAAAGRAGFAKAPIRGYALQQRAFDDEAPAGSLDGMSADDPNDSWYASVYLPGVARSSKAAVAASLLALVATSMPLRVSADEQIPAGSLSGQSEEDVAPCTLPPRPTAPVNAALYEPEEDDVIAFAAVATIVDEDYGTGPPRSQPWGIFLDLPYEPDQEDAPALFGVPEEDCGPPALTRARSITAALYAPDPDDGLPVAAPATVVDEDGWTQPLARRPALTLYTPDADEQLPAPTAPTAIDEDTWTPPLPATQRRAPQVVTDEDFPALYGVPEEDAWIAPVPKRAATAPLYRPDADDGLPVVAAPVCLDEECAPLTARAPVARAALYLPDADSAVPVPPPPIAIDDDCQPLAKWPAPPTRVYLPPDESLGLLTTDASAADQVIVGEIITGATTITGASQGTTTLAADDDPASDLAGTTSATTYITGENPS